MQNEANYTNAGNQLKGSPKAAQPNNQSSILTVPCAPGINGKAKPITQTPVINGKERNEKMQNEPNYKHTRPKADSTNTHGPGEPGINHQLSLINGKSPIHLLIN